MVENEEITGTMRGDGDGDLVSDFIGRLFLSFKITQSSLAKNVCFSILQSKLRRRILTSLNVGSEECVARPNK